MTDVLAELEQATGGLWPYLVVVFIGFLPTEIWRIVGVFFGQSLDENSEALVWVRMVATALVTAVVFKLVMAPTGALAAIPLIVRVGAVAAGIAVMFMAKRSVLIGLLAGELALLAGALHAGV
ncbi:MAG: AzlD domain-containing protein [Beijerinckiaceae bacterium]